MMNIGRVFSVIALGVLMSACSNSPEQREASEVEKNQTSHDEEFIGEFEQHMAEWQEMKPSIERLILIEAELKALIQEVTKMAEKSKKPPRIQKTVMTSEPTTNVTSNLPIKDQPSNTITTEVSFSGYALQVFTVDNKDTLNEKWNTWSEKYSETLRSHPKVYQKTVKDGATYFRIKITDFVTKQAALSACSQIKNQGGDCFLTNDAGTVF